MPVGSAFRSIVLVVSPEIIRIATRKSPLAVWQAEHVAERLRRVEPGIKTELVRMTTRGDHLLDAPLAKVGGKGLFVKELEQRLLLGDADIAVHSMKDVPVEFPTGLHLGAILRRDDPRDALVSRVFSSYSDMPDGCRIGTSSLRRQCQIKARRPHCKIIGLRGNVNTRLSKLDCGDFDAIVLAAAGLKRLGLEARITEALDVSISLPAIGQGAIGIECRCDDDKLNEIILRLHDHKTNTCVIAERAMNRRLEGGCQVPIAGYAELIDDQLHLRGLVGSPDGDRLIRGQVSGSAVHAEKMGRELAENLLSRGADRILKALYDS